VNRCIDHNIGDLLHAFELDQLDSEQQEAFELHLLSCDQCFEQASKFEGVASLLRSDADVRELVSSATTVPEAQPEPESMWSRLRDAFWPKTNFLLKPMVSYLIVILLAVPAYMGLRRIQDQPVQGVQSLLLVGTRSLEDHKVTAGQPLVIMFRIDGAREGLHFRVSVRTDQNAVIYDNDHFDDFNDREMATLLLSAGSVSLGQYHIVVYPPDSDRPLHEYTFVVE
jgi:hypothetical protein